MGAVQLIHVPSDFLRAIREFLKRSIGYVKRKMSVVCYFVIVGHNDHPVLEIDLSRSNENQAKVFYNDDKFYYVSMSMTGRFTRPVRRECL